MYARILVAVDGSETSQAALIEAVNLAKAHKSQVRIVHVVDVVPFFMGDTYYVTPPNVEEALVEGGNKIVAAAAASARQAGCVADTKVLRMEQAGERITDALVAEAKSWPADLMVLGTHGRRGLSHLFLGSVAEGVIRLAPVPVLLIREKRT